MTNRNYHLLFLRLALFFSVLGSGMTWTGLGYELSVIYDEPGFMGIMQVISAFASLLGPLIVVFLPLNISIKSILIYSDVISGLCYVFLYVILIDPNLHGYGFSTASILVFIGMIFGAIQTIYFEPLYASIVARNHSKNALTREFAQLGSYITFSKLLGMGIGPIVFSSLMYYPILFNAFTFFISACLFYFALKNEDLCKTETENKLNKPFVFRYDLIFNKIFLEGAIASSLIYIVVLFLSVKLITLQATATEMSIYWISATICALISQIVISKSLKLQYFLEEIDNKAGFLFSIPILASIFINDVWSLIFCQMVFSFLNPISRNSARAHFYQHFGDRDRTSVSYAMRDFVSQTIILFLGVLISFQLNFIVFNALFISLLIFLRWLFSKSRSLYVEAK